MHAGPESHERRAGSLEPVQCFPRIKSPRGMANHLDAYVAVRHSADDAVPRGDDRANIVAAGK